MKRFLAFILLIITLLLNPSLIFSQTPFIEMRLSLTPEAILINGKPTTYLEYYIANISGDTLHLKKLELIEGATSKVIASLDNNNLKTRLGRIGAPAKSDETILPPGATSVLYLEFVIETDKLKAHFIPRLEFEVIKGDERKSTSFSGSFYISKTVPLILGAPLGVGTWAAVYEPSWERGHRRVIYTIDGGSRIPGRFAIDFIRLDDQGKYANGTDNEIKNWYGYGADVLAVSDGVVASVRDDFQESATLSEHPRYPSDKATGNYISIAMGKGKVVFYEHLKPGSIKVKQGQKVKKGDVIAALGLTGQTTGPHLHFHVGDRNSPLGAEGIPFVFERFTVFGSYPDMEKFGKEVWVPVKNHNQLVRGERPGPNFVIQF
jgi:hypothetical protein